MDKYNELNNRFIELIEWSYEQRKIDYDQKEFLIESAEMIKDKLDKE